MAAVLFPNRRRHPCRYPARRGVDAPTRGRSRKERDELASSMGGARLGKVRVAIIGVGNCASALVQGVHYYRDAADDALVPGLMHVNLGGYHVRDIEFSAAFDVDANKVGQDLSEAIFTKPNNAIRFAEVPPLDVTVGAGAHQPAQRGRQHAPTCVTSSTAR